MPRLLVIQHVPHERLGSLEPVFKAARCTLQTLHAEDPKAAWPFAREFDGLISMGGPQSVYEQAAHPYLRREIDLMRTVLQAEKPVLGICLGAQLLAAALGAKVSRNAAGKEIGWYPLMREPGADGDALCAPFGQTETVFQWHGDAFELPKGAVRLFSSPLCEQQAFRFRRNAYGLQFHVEITPAMARAWLAHPANRRELAALEGRIDPAAIAAQTPRHIGRLQELSRHVARAWCALLAPATRRRPSRRLAHARA